MLQHFAYAGREPDGPEVVHVQWLPRLGDQDAFGCLPLLWQSSHSPALVEVFCQVLNRAVVEVLERLVRDEVRAGCRPAVEVILNRANLLDVNVTTELRVGKAAVQRVWFDGCR